MIHAYLVHSWFPEIHCLWVSQRHIINICRWRLLTRTRLHVPLMSLLTGFHCIVIQWRKPLLFLEENVHVHSRWFFSITVKSFCCGNFKTKDTKKKSENKKKNVWTLIIVDIRSTEKGTENLVESYFVKHFAQFVKLKLTPYWS